MKQSLAFCID